jgi:methionyl-tRNA synthetase
MGMAEKKGMQDRALLAIAVAAESVRICSILLQPFIPTIAAKVLDLLAVDPLRRGFAFAEPFVDAKYGHRSPHDHETPLPKLPFPPDPRS